MKIVINYIVIRNRLTEIVSLNKRQKLYRFSGPSYEHMVSTQIHALIIVASLLLDQWNGMRNLLELLYCLSGPSHG